MSWPQPREGITGTNRDVALLSLDETAIPYRDALIALARQLRSAVLVGSPAPIVASLWQRVSHPVPGDLVVEVTQALHWRAGEAAADDRLRGFGILLAARREWGETDAEWAAYCRAARDAPGADADMLELICSEENRGTETAIYIQYGPDPADICRWVNATVMAIPAVPDWE